MAGGTGTGGILIQPKTDWVSKTEHFKHDGGDKYHAIYTSIEKYRDLSEAKQDLEELASESQMVLREGYLNGKDIAYTIGTKHWYGFRQKFSIRQSNSGLMVLMSKKLILQHVAILEQIHDVLKSDDS